jgi:hypothetical protein
LTVIVIRHCRSLLKQPGERVHIARLTTQAVLTRRFRDTSISRNQTRETKMAGFNCNKAKVLASVRWNDRKTAATNAIGFLHLAQKTRGLNQFIEV